MKRATIKYPISICVIICILFLSLMNPPKSSIPTFSGMDKIVHALMYGICEVIIWIEYIRYYDKLHKFRIMLVIAIPILFGILMEFAQQFFTQNRSGDIYDAIANSVGVFIGATIGYAIAKIHYRS